MKAKKWKLVHSEVMLHNPWITVAKNIFDVPGSGRIADYYIVERRDFVLVIATLNHDHLLMVKQYRPATDRFYLSLPAGYLELGETPLAAASRELAEETGFKGINWKEIGRLDPLPGYVKSQGFIVSCDAVGESNNSQFDQSEITEVLTVSWTEAEDMVINGGIDEMQAACAILLYSQLRRKNICNLSRPST